MSGKKINYLLIAIFSIFIFVFGFILINNIDSSYAYEVNEVTYPTSDFTTNYRNNSINYIKDALDNNSSTSNIVNSFNVPDNFAISSNGGTLYLLQRNLEVPGSTEKFEILAENPTTINDPGIIYIINHGYNSFNKLNHIFTDTSSYGTANVQQKQYVTQIALWLYIAENESKFTDICANNACKFVNNSGNVVSASEARTLINTCSSYSNYKYLKYIISLVDNAKAYRGYTGEPEINIKDIDRTVYELSEDKSYIYLRPESIEIAKGGDNFLYYTIEINDPDNTGVFLSDNNGNKINTSGIYSRDFSYRISIPLKDKMDTLNLRNVDIRIVAHFVTDNPIRNYRVTDSSNGLILPAPLKSQKYSNVLLGVTQETAYEVTYSLFNFTTISKVDIVNGKELPGAKLKITNKETDAIFEWVSTNIPLYMVLENGNYTLCEEIAPEGYKKKEECIDFTVDGTHVVSLKMENEPIKNVPTPNTSLFSGKTKYIIGFLLLFIGGNIFIFTCLRSNNLES